MHQVATVAMEAHLSMASEVALSLGEMFSGVLAVFFSHLFGVVSLSGCWEVIQLLENF